MSALTHRLTIGDPWNTVVADRCVLKKVHKFGRHIHYKELITSHGLLMFVTWWLLETRSDTSVCSIILHICQMFIYILKLLNITHNHEVEWKIAQKTHTRTSYAHDFLQDCNAQNASAQLIVWCMILHFMGLLILMSVLGCCLALPNSLHYTILNVMYVQ